MWYLAYLAHKATERRERLARRPAAERSHAKPAKRGT
jgi:hypothetical protein